MNCLGRRRDFKIPLDRSSLVLLAFVAACIPERDSTEPMAQECAMLPCTPGSGGAAGVTQPPTGGAGGPSASGGAGASPVGTGGSDPVSGAGGTGGTDASAPLPTGGSGGAPMLDAAMPEPCPPGSGDGIVGEHGMLKVSGNRVVDRCKRPIQLRGMSFFWSQWTDFYRPDNVDVLVGDWKATVVRAALGVESGGYLSDPQANVDKVRAVVDRAIERDVYVIIDWHDHHAQDHTAQAKTFFQEMASAYGSEPHVMFEVYNEPLDDVEWTVVKAYAEEIIGTIRATGSQNMIIVGSPTWSQDVDVAAADPITSDDNVAYTLHFYANTHRQPLRNKAMVALNAGLALFVTEWGTCSADGNGAIDEAETQRWLDFMSEHSISWANWSLNDKAEACSAVAQGAGTTGPWRDDQLTASGRLVKAAIP